VTVTFRLMDRFCTFIVNLKIFKLFAIIAMSNYLGKVVVEQFFSIFFITIFAKRFCVECLQETVLVCFPIVIVASNNISTRTALMCCPSLYPFEILGHYMHLG
jgi:hypothetical protein